MKRPYGMLLMCILAVGCTRTGARVEPPALSPSDAAEKAMSAHDGNRDGTLDAAELEKCPSLKSALTRWDANGDGKLTAREIEDRLQVYVDSRTGIAAVQCRILLDDRSLSGATVVFEPEPFLGSSFKPARGETEDDGAVSLRTEGYDVEGLPYGLYRVRVSKKDGSGRETIPARYNDQTTLGQEIGPDLRGDIIIKVSRR